MRNQLVVLVLVIASIALLYSLGNSPAEQTVDGIRLGEERAAVEASQRKVEWICGRRLGNRKGKTLLTEAARKSPSPGYCMAGPCGWRLQQGQLSIAGGGESGDDQWTVLLMAPGPVSQSLTDR